MKNEKFIEVNGNMLISASYIVSSKLMENGSIEIFLPDKDRYILNFEDDVKAKKTFSALGIFLTGNCGTLKIECEKAGKTLNEWGK